MDVLKQAEDSFQSEWKKTEDVFLGHALSTFERLLGMEIRLLKQWHTVKRLDLSIDGHIKEPLWNCVHGEGHNLFSSPRGVKVF